MKKILLMAFFAVFFISAFAQQHIYYNVIAKVPYNARTMQYGKIDPLNMKIVRIGNQTVYIGPDKYSIKSINTEFKDSVMQYIEYDAVSETGEEYTIKIAYDGTATAEVMRHFVLIFKDNDIYNWTYYYTSAGEETENKESN